MEKLKFYRNKFKEKNLSSNKRKFSQYIQTNLCRICDKSCRRYNLCRLYTIISSWAILPNSNESGIPLKRSNLFRGRPLMIGGRRKSRKKNYRGPSSGNFFLESICGGKQFLTEKFLCPPDHYWYTILVYYIVF